MVRKWVTLKLPEGIIKWIDRFLQTDQAKELGYTSRPDIVVHSIRELLGRYENTSPRLSHLHISSDNVTVYDNQLGRLVTVRIRDQKLYCEVDQTDQCIHTAFVSSLEKVNDFLGK
ncbi:MAG: ribbon-helix-helix domain-containing protein [Candidatus Methylarchaceae archaeon HK01B]|nr:ribbon-helix-helix domain-containing protein [Candidatus Methylarchaceae archaeon HK01B]